jgi:hypothetical protein
VFHTGNLDVNWFRILFTASAVMILAMGALPTFTQTEYGHYSPGAGGPMKMAILPTSGFVLENGTLVFLTREFVDGSGNSTSYGNNGIANSTSVQWVSEKKTLGARYSTAVIIPFANFAGPRPLPGNDTTMGLGDIVLQPVTLGWQKGSLYTLWAYTVFIPTGRFTLGASDDLGRGFWSHMFTWAVTWIPEVERPWNASVQVR